MILRYLLVSDKGKTGDGIVIKICFEHIDSSDLPVKVSGVIIDTGIGVTAGGIYGLFKSVSHRNTTLCLLDNI